MSTTLIHGAYVITLDQQGDLPDADILIQNDRILEIGYGLSPQLPDRKSVV